MKMERFIVAWLWEKLRVRGYLHKGVKDCEGVSDLKPMSLSALLFAELHLFKKRTFVLVIPNLVKSIETSPSSPQCSTCLILS